MGVVDVIRPDEYRAVNHLVWLRQAAGAFEVGYSQFITNGTYFTTQLLGSGLPADVVFFLIGLAAVFYPVEKLMELFVFTE